MSHGFLFSLETVEGEPADPPTHSSAVTNIKPGDEIPLGRRSLRVVGRRDDDADQPPVHTVGGRVVAVFVMLFGIGFLSILTRSSHLGSSRPNEGTRPRHRSVLPSASLGAKRVAIFVRRSDGFEAI